MAELYKSINLITEKKEIEYCDDKQTNLLVISSKDRNSTLFKSPAKYNVLFPSNYLNVTSLELVESIIPSDLYTISNNCNKLVLSTKKTKVKGYNIVDTIHYLNECKSCGSENKVEFNNFEKKCKNIEFDSLDESNLLNINIPKGFYNRDIILPVKIKISYNEINVNGTPTGTFKEYEFYKHWDFLAYNIQQQIFNNNDLNINDKDHPVLLVFYDINKKNYEFTMFNNDTDSFFQYNQGSHIFMENTDSKPKLNSFFYLDEKKDQLELKIKIGNFNNMFRLYFSKGLIPYGNQSLEKVPSFYPDGSIKREIHKEIRDGNIVEVQGDIIYTEKKIGEKDYAYLDNSIGSVIGFDKKNLLGNMIVHPVITGNNNIIFFNEIDDLYINDFIQLVDHTIGDDNWDIKPQVYIIVSIDYQKNTIEILPNINQDSNNCKFIQKCTYHSQFTSNLDFNKNVILNIDNIEAIQSNDTIFNKSYNLFSDEKKIRTLINPVNYGLNSALYCFNPPLKNFSKLNINFTDLNGNLYDFGGLNNTLIFSIGKLNSLKYIKNI